MVVDYANAKIYKIVSERTDRVYIGSTVNSLNKRFRNHRSVYNSLLRGKCLQCSSSFIMRHGDARIELLETFPCENKLQLTKREGELILQNTPNAVNILIPGRDMKEVQRLHKQWPARKRRIARDQ